MVLVCRCNIDSYINDVLVLLLCYGGDIVDVLIFILFRLPGVGFDLVLVDVVVCF